MMRVAIVNDLKIAIETLRRAVTSDSQHTIAWTASDGAKRFVNAAPTAQI